MLETVAKKFVAWSLLVVIVIYVVSGFGMTKPSYVEPWTLGLITRSVGRTIHSNLLIPLIILTAVHIYFTVNLRWILKPIDNKGKKKKVHS
jgi:cytochrome b subunit of formate dehydrogenase